jgi:hypothetical protein
MYTQNRPLWLPGFSPPNTVTGVSSVQITAAWRTNSFSSSYSGPSKSATLPTQSQSVLRDKHNLACEIGVVVPVPWGHALAAPAAR